MAGALEGIRVLDMGRVLAGPSSAALMGDMGAEVIKLEQPGRGDDSRGFAPMKNGVSCYYKNFNRSKKGITLDLKTGKDVFLELVKTVDVLVENFRPGTMKKLGLGYEELKKINPGLIYGWHLRLRLDRPVQKPCGLRHDVAGMVRRNEHHRLAGGRPRSLRCVLW